MIAFILTILLGTLAAVFAAGQYRAAVDDNAAASTGRYLLQIRGAVVELQLKHQSWIGGEPSGQVADPPGLTWRTVGDAQIARGGVEDLVRLGLLASHVPRYPLLGDAVRFLLVRRGDCPGEHCQSSAYVYTCHPISGARSRRQPGDCARPTGERTTFSPALLAKVLMSADGYGGHDARGTDKVTGPLMNVPRAWFGFQRPAGHAVLSASLDATPFGQFVRHGETRPVTLRNTLSVAQTIQSDKGLLLNTAVRPGSRCATEGLYASTPDKLLAVCINASWFANANHVVTGVYRDLPHQATLPPLACPPGLAAWRHVALQNADVTATGGDIHVAGEVGGSIHGSGSVNAAGAVSVHGGFNGAFRNAGNSYVRVTQRVSIVGDRVLITPGGHGARAAVIQGCKG